MCGPFRTRTRGSGCGDHPARRLSLLKGSRAPRTRLAEPPLSDEANVPLRFWYSAILLFHATLHRASAPKNRLRRKKSHGDLVTVWLPTRSKSFRNPRNRPKRQSSPSSSVSKSLAEFRKGQKTQYLDSKSRSPCGHEGSTPSFGIHSIRLTETGFFTKPRKQGDFAHDFAHTYIVDGISFRRGMVE